MTQRATAVVLATILGSAALGAQTGARSTSGAQERGRRPGGLTFGATARLVEVSVVVRDRDGNPVRDLGPGDFQIFDQGKPQTLSTFSVETDAPAPESVAAAEAQGVFHNQHAARGGVTVVLLDRLNTAWEDQAYAKKQIVKFLGQIEADDRVGLYVLDSDTVRILHDFTTDASSLLSALARHDSRQSGELAASEDRPFATGDSEMDVFLADTARIVNAQFLRARAEITCEALASIARHLASVRGRKNLVWVSSSFPLTFDDPIGRPATPGLSTGNVSAEVQRATRAMSEAGVAVYPVDARGLLGAFAVNPASIPFAPNAGRTVLNAFTTLESSLPALDTAKAVAENTGGRAFHSTNDIGGAIRRAFDDARVTYLLGFVPAHDDWNGRFREIKVRVARPGVEARHRRGYVAGPLRERDRKESAAALGDALRSPLEASSLAVGVRIEKLDGSERDVNLSIRLDPRPISLDRRGERWTGAVSLLIAQSTAAGRAHKDFDGNIELSLNADARARLLDQGIVLNKKIRLRDDLHRLHVVAGDPPTGVVGSVIVPVDKVRGALARVP